MLNILQQKLNIYENLPARFELNAPVGVPSGAVSIALPAYAKCERYIMEYPSTRSNLFIIHLLQISHIQWFSCSYCAVHALY